MVTFQEWADWVGKQLKGHQAGIQSLRNELMELRRKLSPIFAEHMEPRILKALTAEGKPRSWRWFFRRFGPDAWESLQNLKEKGLVIQTRSGAHTMYVAGGS